MFVYPKSNTDVGCLKVLVWVVDYSDQVTPSQENLVSSNVFVNQDD